LDWEAFKDLIGKEKVDCLQIQVTEKNVSIWDGLVQPRLLLYFRQFKTRQLLTIPVPRTSQQAKVFNSDVRFSSKN